MHYLIDDNDCEHAFVRGISDFWPIYGVLESLDVDPHLCWALLEINMSELTTSLKGDVDILVGRMAWDDPQMFKDALDDVQQRRRSASPLVAEERIIDLESPENLAATLTAMRGGLMWPPPTDFFAGIEVKCAHLDSNVDLDTESVSIDHMKSTKSAPRKTRRIQLQIDSLHQLGCDRVALLDLIAHPPADGVGAAAWANALAVANKTSDVMEGIYSGRLKPGTTAGHWVYSLGAVRGGNENMRGAGSLQVYRRPQENACLTDFGVQSRRLEVKGNLNSLFGKLPKPRTLPALFISCHSCNKIYRCGMNHVCCT